MAVSDRAYVTANYWLQMDGMDCGIVSKVSGGYIQAEVQEIAQNGNFYVKKCIGGLKYSPFKLDLAGIMAGPLVSRIEALLAANHSYFNGAIMACDFNLKTKAIREFTNALLTSVTLPACDAAKGKEAAYLQVEFESENLRNRAGDGSSPSGATKVSQKKLSGANFNLHIDALKDATKRVNKIEPMPIKMAVQRDQVGFQREYEMVASKGVTFPNLSFSVAEIDAHPIYAWHQKFVIEGHCTEQDETTAELTYYSQSLKDELITVTFRNVGIFNCQPDDNKDQDEAIKRVKVECYCEKIEIAFKGV